MSNDFKFQLGVVKDKIGFDIETDVILCVI